MASFMMGQLIGGGAYYEIQFEVASENYQYAGFAQDNWKVTPKLTLNLGLRYDVSLPRTERHNRMNWFDPNVVSPLSVPGLGTLYGGEMFNSASVRSDWADGLERHSAAFRLRLSIGSKTVLRGGYGIYFSQPRSRGQWLVELRLAGLQPVHQCGHHLSKRWRDALAASQ